ncbi:hypothetical protein RSAG8_06693, partial [Rhizoctonia solani AG-8 WAC10335]
MLGARRVDYQRDPVLLLESPKCPRLNNMRSSLLSLSSPSTRHSTTRFHVVSGFLVVVFASLKKIACFTSRVEATFHLWGILPSNLVSPAKQILKFTSSFLDPETKHFDWEAYISRIRQHPAAVVFLVCA